MCSVIGHAVIHVNQNIIVNSLDTIFTFYTKIKFPVIWNFQKKIFDADLFKGSDTRECYFSEIVHKCNKGNIFISIFIHCV